MKKIIIALAFVVLVVLGYACKKEDNPTTLPDGVQLTATLSGHPASTSSTTTTASGTFTGQLSQPSNVLSYTVTYAALTPTAVSLDPAATSTSLASGTSPYTNSILLAGAFPTSTTNPGSGTSTSPGSGTSTNPGSGTSTNPGSGTSTSPGSGTAVTLTSPLSGTVSLSQTQANNLTGGQYQLTIRSTAYPNGELTGPVRIR